MAEDSGRLYGLGSGIDADNERKKQFLTAILRDQAAGQNTPMGMAFGEFQPKPQPQGQPQEQLQGREPTAADFQRYGPGSYGGEIEQQAGAVPSPQDAPRGVNPAQASPTGAPMQPAPSSQRGAALPKALGVSQSPQVTTAAEAPSVEAAGKRNWQQEQDTAYGQSDSFRRQAMDALVPKQEDLQKMTGLGNMNMVTAMRMMALGGDEMQGIGGQVLKQAMAQQGQGQMDPAKLAELKAKKLDVEASVWERRAATAGTREDKETARAQAERLHKESIEQRREASQLAAGARAATLAGTAEARDARTADRQSTTKFNQGMKLSKEYDSRIKNFSLGRQSAETLLNLAMQPSAAKDPAAQVAMVFAFGKMLDPTSVVRESEYRLFEEARGLLDSWGITPDRIRAGVRLTPTQIQQMSAIAAKVSQTAEDRQQALKDYYASKAKRWELDPTDVMPDYMPSSASPKTNGGSGIDVGARLQEGTAPGRRANDGRRVEQVDY